MVLLEHHVDLLHHALVGVEAVLVLERGSLGFLVVRGNLLKELHVVQVLVLLGLKGKK